MKSVLKKVVSVLCAAVLIFSSFIVVNAEGSTSLNSVATGRRTFSEWYALSNDTAYYTTAGIVRQQKIYVYAKAGETINFGSSVRDSYLNLYGSAKSSSVTGNDIVMITTDGEYKSYDVDKNGDGVGYIDTYAKEQNGPNIGSVTNGYSPYTYTAKKSGVYEFHFHSQKADHSNPNTSTASNNSFVTN